MKRYLLIWCGWALSLVLLGSIVFIVPVRDVWQALRLTQPLFVVPGIFLVLVHLRFRGSRWALLFQPHYQISGSAASVPVIIGLAVNGVLPGKVGELMRIGLGARQFKTSLTFTTMTAISDRLFDALTLLVLLGGALFLVPEYHALTTVHIFRYEVRPEVLSRLATTFAATVLLLLGLIVCLMFARTRTFLLQVFNGLPIIGGKFHTKIEHIFTEAAHGLAALRDTRIFLKVMLFSGLIWLPPALTTQLVSLGIPGIHLNFFQALIVTVISIGMTSIPSAPGSWGVFETGTLLALKLLNIPWEPRVSVAFALILHLSFYLPIVLTGAILFLKVKRQPSGND
jgi:uncharacterized protein (TIRG00374 family)